MPGLPLPPPPPWRPPPQDDHVIAQKKIAAEPRIRADLPKRGLMLCGRRSNQNMHANGRVKASRAAACPERGMAAVVVIVRVTTESPLPDPTWVGLKAHVVSAGSLEQLKATPLGKVPVVGETSRL